jgi:hypothetical protein
MKRKYQQQDDNNLGCIYWAIAIALFMGLAFGCTPSFKTTGIVQARLKEVHNISPGKDSLILLNRKGETIHFLNGSGKRRSTRFIINDYYSIRYDSLKTINSDSVRLMKAKITHSY